MTGWLDLSVSMVERVGIVIILAFLLVNVRAFRRLIFSNSWLSRIQLVIIFGAFAVLANLTGVEIDVNNHILANVVLLHIPAHYSIANARTLAVSAAGIIGGPWVGGTVGLIAGLFRVMQGGWLSWFYLPSSMIIGIFSGLVYKDKDNQVTIMTPRQGLVVGFSVEMVQMIFILLFSPTGWKLVRFIAIPMITINAIGTSIFLSIMAMFLRQETETRATQTQQVLQLADRTLPYFREGLNLQSAGKVAKVIMDYTNFDAISITSRTEILAHVGAGSDHHRATKAMVTKLSAKTIATNRIHVAYSKAEIGCSYKNCPLAAAIVVPLDVHDEVVGTAKFYYTESWRLTPVEIQLATGLGNIFASQIALGVAENQAKLVRDAEIKSLQAQVNPHFFFNAINTISAVMRFDIDKARELLLELSTYFRSNLVGARETQVTLKQEKRQLSAYLSLEQTRFPDKYDVRYNIDASDSVLLPPFTIQVLVENAMKHAFGSRKSGNVVKINVVQIGKKLKIQVVDNGIGIDPAKLPKLGKEQVKSKRGSGTALQNLNQRLTGLYGVHSRLHFDTGDSGTTVTTYIPLTIKEAQAQ